MGRPSKFRNDFCDQAVKLCRLGATDKELADFFDIAEQTLYTWKKQHPEFLEALKEGKAESDALVGQRLFERAIGYSHPEEKIFCNGGEVVRAETVKQYAPDTTACIFWLKNRRPDLWRDRQEVTGADGGPLSINLIRFADSNTSE